MKNYILLVVLLVVLVSASTVLIFNLATLGLPTKAIPTSEPAPPPPAQKYTCVTNASGQPQCIKTDNGVTLDQCTKNCKKHGRCDGTTCSETGSGAVCNIGSNECSQLTHFDCVDITCKPVPGGGKPMCNTGPDCGKTEHLDCKDKKCQPVSGPGGPQCMVPTPGQKDMCESTQPPVLPPPVLPVPPTLPPSPSPKCADYGWSCGNENDCEILQVDTGGGSYGCEPQICCSKFW